MRLESDSFLLVLSSICVSLISRHVHGQMNDNMRNKLLALHNNARQAVQNGQLSGQPMAVSIKPLRWNMELERKAQILSDQCRVGHDTADERKIPPFDYVGQNWAGSADVETGFQMWLDEYKNYDFTSRTCRAGQCGHYTQIVWESTTDVGCGVTNCPNFPYGLSIVCNYGPGGNYAGRSPYSTSSSSPQATNTNTNSQQQNTGTNNYNYNGYSGNTNTQQSQYYTNTYGQQSNYGQANSNQVPSYYSSYSYSGSPKMVPSRQYYYQYR